MPNALRYAGWSHSHDWILSKALHTLSFWVEYLKHARVLCWFLNQDSYRQLLVQALKATSSANPNVDFEWNTEDAQRFHANFAHWRFGTMARVSNKLSSAKLWVQAGFDPSRFTLKDAGKLKEVQDVIRSETFWHQNQIVNTICANNETARKWGLGCHCHADECRDAARKGPAIQLLEEEHDGSIHAQAVTLLVLEMAARCDVDGPRQLWFHCSLSGCPAWDERFDILDSLQIQLC
jgi:hypothetical protein